MKRRRQRTVTGVNTSIRLGTIRGIEIGLNWSWLVIFALIVWTLATGVFPDQNPGLSDGTYVAMATIAATAFFASLLAHELGHAFQARREGMEIDGITLWLFGGVARFKGQFPSAGSELRIAVAGPAVSLVIGIAFVLIARADLPSSVDGVVFWLGSINLILLVFNLLPALPLDGGRVLRSLLWKARGDLSWATGVAANVGRSFGYLMIAGGVFLLIFEGIFTGAWLAFIGWFLWTAATAEQRYLATRQLLGGRRVRDLMVSDLVTVDSELSLGRFIDEVVFEHRHTTYPVMDGGRPVGLLPFRCVAEIPRQEWDGRRVRDCMIPLDRVQLLEPDAQLVDAVQALMATEVRRALVLEDGRLVGLLSITDVSRVLEVGSWRRSRPS
jgi:Zn-dependent protease